MRTSGLRARRSTAVRLLSVMALPALVAISTVSPLEPAHAAGPNSPTAHDDTYSVFAGTTLSVPAPGILANDTDPNGDALHVFGVFGGPSHGTAKLNADGSFTYTPTAGYVGGDQIAYILQDSMGNFASSTGSIFLTVLSSSPTAHDDTYSVFAGTTLSVPAPGILANDTDPNGDALHVFGVFGGPSHGTAKLNADGSFTYTPTAGYVGGDQIAYILQDSMGNFASSTGSIFLTVLSSSPTAHDDTYSVFAGTTLSVPAPGILANDTDPNGDALHVFGVFGGPSHGTAKLNADGSFTYTPTAGYVGGDQIAYILQDSMGNFASATGSIFLTVNAAAADLSVAKTCDPGPVAPGATVNCSVSVSNAGPSPAQSISVSDDLPAGMTLVGTPSGGGFTCGTGDPFTCTLPSLAANGSATFTFKVQVSGAPATLVNTVRVSSATADPGPRANTATSSTTVVACTITGAGDITGTQGNDVICGSAGPDRIAGLGGDDLIFGFGGDDQISGGEGNDTIYGGSGSDQLAGGNGNDVLVGGGGGVDRLAGGAGDDTLNTVDGSADDFAVGGDHVNGDTCVVDPGDSVATCEQVVRSMP